MSWKLFGSDVTSAEARLPIPSLGSRYEEAWKEFDKLNAAVHGCGPARWIRSAFDIALLSGAVFGLKFWHEHREVVALVFASYVGFGLAYAQIMKGRFEHWQCPRCHAEWPGTKKEKGSRCRVCGLKLHELA